ncbi:MAG: galactokinase [Actinomycetota bacterium]
MQAFSGRTPMGGSTFFTIFRKQEELFLEKFGHNLSPNQELVNILSPGRVNIIGEHTDYNNGLSIAAAIDRYIFITGAKNNSNLVEAYSQALGQSQKFSINNICYDENAGWINYIKGVVKGYMQNHQKIGGFGMALSTNLPIGAGISSSAALEVGVGKFLEEAFKLEISIGETVRYCNWSENNFVGVKCGFLDQITVAYGKKDHAVFIDFKDLCCEYIPFRLGDNTILIVDSGQKRNLYETEYNKRGRECREALKQVNLILEDNSIKSLSDISMHMLGKIEDRMDKKLFRRARHVVTENDRVKKAKKAIMVGDMNKLGSLLISSHSSLRDDYEVSTERLDFLVEEICRIEGVYGARLMGAGFGGNIIAIVKKRSAEVIASEVGNKFKSRFGVLPCFIQCLPSDGTKRFIERGCAGDRQASESRCPASTGGFSKKTVLKEDGRYLIYYNF